MRQVLGMLTVLLLAAPAWAQEELTIARVHLGAAGADCTLHAASGAPSGGLGSDCDVYHRTDAPFTVYTKVGGTWTPGLLMPSGATAGDLVTVASVTASGRVAAVAAGQVLASAGTSTAPSYTASPALTSIGGAANLTLNPTGDLVLNPTGNDVLPTTNYDINLGALTLKYLTLHAAELWVETLVAQNTIATIGGRVLVGPTTTLTSDLTSGATSIVVKHNQMASGDRVVLQEDGALEWLAITSGPSGGGPYTYSVTRNLDGSGANAWPAGAAVFNTGTTSDGYIDLYSVNGLLPGSTVGPTVVGNVRTGTTYSDVAPRWAIGNLNGLYGYSADTYGAAFGDAGNSYLSVDATNGIRMIGDLGTMFAMDTAGNATFAGRLTVGTGGRNQLSNSELLRGPDTGRAAVIAGVDGTAWGAYIDESTSLTWSHVCNTGGGSFTIVNGGQCGLTATGTPNTGEYFRAWGPHQPVTAGQRIEFSYYALPYRSRVEARVVFYDESGAYVSESSGNVATSGVLGPTNTTSTQNHDLANWTRAWGISDVPATAVIAVPVVMGTWQTGDGANPTIYYTRMYFGQAQPGQTSPSPWAPGGIALIDGDHLSTDLVISNTIRSSGATALTTGTGFWLDAASTPTFRVGNPSGNQIKWDGTNLTIGQGSVAIDSSGLRLTPATGSSWSDAASYSFAVTGNLGLFGSDQAGASSVYLDSSGTRTVQEVYLRADKTDGAGLATLSVISQASDSIIALSAEDVAITGAESVDIFGEVLLSGISSDGTGKVACVKSDGRLGTCNASSITASGCTCS